MSVVPPIFVFEENDLYICRSLRDVENQLEGPDVQDGVYEAYDSVGHPVLLTAQGVKRGAFTVTPGQVAAKLDLSSPPAVERLTQRLKSSLATADLGQDQALPDLVQPARAPVISVARP